MIKRFFDLVASLFILILLLPVIAVTALAVFLDLGFPVLFIQKRPGLGGRIFRMYKFRTMRDACDKKGNLLSDAERLTKVGKLLRATSLDELPELFNVLKGDMSLVGPRPLLVEYLELYSPKQARRHEARPGITGWAQVNGRNSISWEEKFDMDVWYVDNGTLLLDAKIILLTILTVIRRDGISEAGEATMTPFAGSRR